MSDAMQSEPQPVMATWSRVARRIRVPLSFIFAIAYLWFAHPTKDSLLAGGLLLVPGLVLRGLASGHVQKDRELTTSGPYAYTRNPLYLGSIIMAVGFVVAAQNPWILVMLFVMFAVIYVPVVAGEERYLRKTFPEYDDYARRVPRFATRFTRYGNQRGTFSSERYWKHREYQAVIGCVAVLAVLVVKLVLQKP
ncbi:MAG TPA: isoprenylcysteine carboxylmethyltransferase family protein [Terriglobales bacterium]|jgi:protein-S-isoprenylcysteine O-methyltransferase Ste14|nr:isoprenylcysteine carboxylmethyltransferase family protein [Terriglobales bacterium]